MLSMIILSGCSLTDGFSIPKKFTVCDIDFSYDMDSPEARAKIRIGYCTPAKWLRSEKLK